MEKIKKKKKKGAAMLIALLVFLLAALSGTVVLTMATSNAGRYTHTKEDQQAYLAVMSAAQAVKSEFESGIEASIEYIYKNKSLEKAGEASVSANGIFGSMVNSDMKTTLECIAGYRSEVQTWNEDGSYKPPEEFDGQSEKVYEYILRIGESALSATMGDVAVELTINTTDAKLTFDFYYTGNGSDNYHVSLQIGNGGDQVIKVDYPTHNESAGESRRIKVQFHWDSDGATIQTVS